MTFKEIALATAEKGFYVFPLIPGGKIPTIKDWPNKASRDENEISQWWATSPESNIGICTNRYLEDKALVVIDVDLKHDKNGYAVLKALRSKGDRLVETLSVKTPSGGVHLYYSVDREKNIRSGANVLGKGVDIRADGGFVVAPGSTVNGRKYTVEIDLTSNVSVIAPWVLNHGRHKKLTSSTRPSDRDDMPLDLLDSEQAITRGIEFLETVEDVATHGARDELTYHIAARVQDYGLSNAKTLELMFEYWNPRCPHPWRSKDALMEKIENAHQFRNTAIGSASSENAFMDRDPDALNIHPCDLDNLGNLPPRRWIINHLALGEKVTLLIAPPGVGKSTFSLMAAISVVTGNDLLGGDYKVKARGSAWIINNEDDMDEINRRLAAQIMHMHLGLEGRSALQKGLYLTSGTDRQFLIARRSEGGPLVPQDMDRVIQLVREREITLLIVDPLAETSEADENSNEEMLAVCRMYRKIAQETRCAVIIVHHTRKLPSGASTGHVGNMDSGRGASSMTGVARLVLTLYGMDNKDAKKLGIDEAEKHRYVRLDNAKSNMSLGCPTSWFVKKSVTLPNSDSVGVMVQYEPPMKQTLVEQIRYLMDGESEMPLGDVVSALQNEGVAHRGVSTQTLQRRVIKALEGNESLQVLESALSNGRVERFIVDRL